MKSSSIIPTERIEQRIFFIRDQRVIIDMDLARIFGIPTFRLNEAVKRNRERFPEDFMFQLTREEFTALTSQIAISKKGRGGRRTLPYTFTEHGAIMAANVLNSPRAVQMSVFVVRAFVRLRQVLATHKELAEKLTELERKFSAHDRQIQTIIEAIRQLMTPPEKPKRQIGFRVEEPKARYLVRRKRT
ncbi:MAG: ORF6N domain-containing protein [Bacteroidetes bacterium]|nr:ORF6N domain-containing protein [Bacteroidota bacterium]MBU2636593.1 ORF6N domain-containing protein [Bacteroidota bacterium]